MSIAKRIAARAAGPARPYGSANAINRLAPAMSSIAGAATNDLTGYFVVNVSLVNGTDVIKPSPKGV